MFPLGSVLFPHMPVQLRVFEERYLTMLSVILQETPAEFGVVLIERGQEVGDLPPQRFSYGTVAQIAQLQAAEGFIALVAEGERRIEVIEWLDDSEYPRASIRVLDELLWDDSLLPLLDRAERTVRRALAVASEFGDPQWSATVELSDDPVQSAWQLAAIAPLAELDQVSLLKAASLESLLVQVIELTDAAVQSFESVWPDGPVELDLLEELGDLEDDSSADDSNGDDDDNEADDGGDDPGENDDERDR